MNENHNYFITGFPGFIARLVIQGLLKCGRPVEHLYVLVLPNLVQKAQDEIASIAAQEGVSLDLFTIVPGDITKQGLGIDSVHLPNMKKKITHVFHLAAIYDLAVPYEMAYQVNVVGTSNVTEWVRALVGLQRYVYFSTAYVSGKREGRIMESELQHHAGFKNHYESTKYEAEVIVKQAMSDIPTTIIRPGIVRGDSKTGETIKFDGPYFILNMIDKLSFLPFIPYMGKGDAQGNFVPVDYIVPAVLYLAHEQVGEGKTYHLADPKPYPMRDVYRMLMQEYLGRKPKGMLPLAAAKPFMQIAVIRKWLRVEKEGLDYFSCMAEYDCSQAERDLQGAGIKCPDFQETIAPMVAYYGKHKNDSSKQLNIK
ncbi:SDR family oxidoreductase [Paenibacillus marinisediminis]